MPFELHVPNICVDAAGSRSMMKIRQDELKKEPDARRFIELFEKSKVPIEYWYQLSVSAITF